MACYSDVGPHVRVHEGYGGEGRGEGTHLQRREGGPHLPEERTTFTSKVAVF